MKTLCSAIVEPCRERGPRVKTFPPPRHVPTPYTRHDPVVFGIRHTLRPLRNRRAAGRRWDGRSISRGIVIYSIDTGSYEELTSTGESAQWLSDSRRLVFASGGKLSIVDRQTKTIHDIVSEPGRESRVVSVPRDGRQLFVLLQSTEADVWMATFTRSH